MNCLWLLASNATAQPIVESLTAQGVHVWQQPLINVLPCATSASIPTAAPKRLIFVSANAIAHGLPVVLTALQQQGLSASHPAWPSAWLMGKSYFEPLQQHFPQCFIPAQGHDSEAVLADPAWQADPIRNMQVWLIKGEGGREVLAPALRDRGAQVLEWSVYRRSPATNLHETLTAQWHSSSPAAMVVLSRESLTLLHRAIQHPQFLRHKNDCLACPLYVHHWRIQQLALEYGFQCVYAADGLIAMTALIQKHFGGAKADFH